MKRNTSRLLSILRTAIVPTSAVAKKNKFNIICAWLLLACFTIGQVMVLVHQHKVAPKSTGTYNISKNQPKPAVTVQEKCYLCDVMHQTAATVALYHYHLHVVAQQHIYTTAHYSFISIALVLAAGRAPPVIAAFC